MRTSVWTEVDTQGGIDNSEVSKILLAKMIYVLDSDNRVVSYSTKFLQVKDKNRKKGGSRNEPR